MPRMLFTSCTLACFAALFAYASAQNVNPPGFNPQNLNQQFVSSPIHPDVRTAAMEFYRVLKASFDRWDLDHNGELTGEEVSRDLLDPLIRGNEAAALAVVRFQERKILKTEGTERDLSLRELDPFDPDSDQLTPDGRKLVLSYMSCKRKIFKENRALFGSSIPHLMGIRQGRSSDCFLLATVGAMVNSRPQDIVKMIIANPDGSYTVRFPGAPAEIVPTPTDGEVAAYSDATGDGIWLHVIERAFAQIRDRQGHEDLVEPMDALANHGGSSARTIALMTGHKAKVYVFARSEDVDLGDVITRALQEGRLVDANARGHSCAAIAYNPDNDDITIWNPWGSSSLYKAVGLRMDHGTFTMPLHQLTKRFVSICVEENVPIEHVPIGSNPGKHR